MTTTHAYLQSGQLTQALRQLSTRLQHEPTDLEARSQYIELLCLQGQFERADQQLVLLTQQHPHCLGGASNVRQLLRAAQARLDFAQGADTASLVTPADPATEALLALRMAQNSGDPAAVMRHLQVLQGHSQTVPISINGNVPSDLRDLDDTLSGHLEMFGTNGQYYLVPSHAIERLELKPVESLIELVWRRAAITIDNGPEGEIFIPTTYLNSQTDAQKLGKETDWQTDAVTGATTGLGQKMWLCGNDAMPVTQMTLWQKTHQLESV